MPYLIAQLSDMHIGGPVAGSGERFSMAVADASFGFQIRKAAARAEAVGT